MNPVVSDETLNAFIDGELDAAESERLIAQMRDDPALSQRVNELRTLQSMLAVAYAAPPRSAGTGAVAPRRKRLQRYALAAAVLVAGFGTGWVLRGVETPGQSTVLPGAAITLARLTAEADPGKVLLHIDSAAPGRMQAVLDQAERLLDEAERQGRTMQIEVVANSRGLDLLRAGVSPHAGRIAELRARHAGLQFVACGQTLARFRSEGQQVELLPAIRTAPTAISEIVTRLQQGWTYVRV